MIRRSTLALAAVLLTGCDGFKEAMTAHVDVVARAGSQELSVTHLADVLGNSRAPLSPDVARAATELWVNYQLLGHAAANGDSLNDPKLVDDAMWSVISSTRSSKLYDQISKNWVTDAGSEARYAQGDVLAARHILLKVPPAATPAAKAALRSKAEGLRAQATTANFAQLAQANSEDPGSAPRGGDLGVFRRGDMVPAFEQAILALRPGQISSVIETQFGLHIIRRSEYAEAKPQVDRAANQVQFQRAESLYVANLEQTGKVVVKPNAGAAIKSGLKAMDDNRDNRTVVATSTAGDLTVGRVLRWVEAYPAQASVPQQLAAAPDSLIGKFVRSIARNELVLKQADSAKVELDSAELNAIRRAFQALAPGAWNGLGVVPRMLADSAATETERERLAGRRVDAYFERLVKGEMPFVEVPPQLASALRQEYKYKVYPAGLDRAVERAGKVRAAADSAQKASQPASAVPMPQTPAPETPAAPAPAPPRP